MSPGVYPHISLQEARERAAECRNLLKQGTNPGAKRRDDKLRQQEAGLNTFRRAAEYWYQFKADSGRSSATLKKIRDYLDKDLLPALGEKQLELITRSDCARPVRTQSSLRAPCHCDSPTANPTLSTSARTRTT